MNRHDLNAWVVIVAIGFALTTIVGFVVLLLTGHITFPGT